MTEQLYRNDAYLKELWTKVIAVEGKKVLTEKTIFSPETKEQVRDTGFVDGIPLLGVLKQGEETWHMLEREHLLKPGDEALLKLDWKKRLHSMRLHTALHMLAQVFKREFRIYADSLRIDAEGAHLEFNKEVDLQTIDKALAKANELIQGNTEIDASIDELSGKKVINIGYLPKFECDGLFVKEAKEIGAISFSGGNFSGEKFIISLNVEFNNV